MSAKKDAKPKKNDNKDRMHQQIAELTDALQRERADADNIRKRADADRVAALATGREIAIGQMLPLLDNLQRAFIHMPDDLKENKWAKGVQALESQMQNIMKDFGLQKIETVGNEFDPELMEAVSVEETGDSEEEKVSEELQAGYLLNGKVLRVAMVRVKK